MSKVDSYQIALLGATQSGKSAIACQFCQNYFVEEFEPTICDDDYRKQRLVDGRPCLIRIEELMDPTTVDHCYNERWTKPILQQSDAVVLVYSISSRSTFTQIASLYNYMLEAQSPNSGRDGDMQRPRYSKPFCLVGTKGDVREREISQSEGLEQAKKLGCPFFETSAKTCLNIEACFDSLARAIYGNAVDITESNMKCRHQTSFRKSIC